MDHEYASPHRLEHGVEGLFYGANIIEVHIRAVSIVDGVESGRSDDSRDMHLLSLLDFTNSI
jgi:hypothetical protein